MKYLKTLETIKKLNIKSLTIVALLILGIFSMSAQTKSDLYNSSEIVWYGLDFSKVKLIGSHGFTNPPEIKNRYFNSWNLLILSEPDKYNLKEVFSKNKVEYDLSVVEQRNKMPLVEELVINKDYSFDESEISGILSQYNYEQTEGIGLVFIIESFNKINLTGTMYVTFFDIATKKPILIKKMTGKPSGFGIRNYWAGSVYSVLKTSKEQYSKWITE